MDYDLGLGSVVGRNSMLLTAIAAWIAVLHFHLRGKRAFGKENSCQTSRKRKTTPISAIVIQQAIEDAAPSEVQDIASGFIGETFESIGRLWFADEYEGVVRVVFDDLRAKNFCISCNVPINRCPNLKAFPDNTVFELCGKIERVEWHWVYLTNVTFAIGTTLLVKPHFTLDP